MKSFSHLSVNKFDDLFKVNIGCGSNNIKIKYNGYFFDHIRSLNNDEAKNLTNLAEIVRYYARDKFDNLMIHSLMYCKKEICVDDYISKFVNVRNSNMINCIKRIVLHYACYTDDLNIVKSTVKYGGPIEQIKSYSGKYPSDYTTNAQIEQYVKQIQTELEQIEQYPFLLPL